MTFETYFEIFFEKGMPCSFNYGGRLIAGDFGGLTRCKELDGASYEMYTRCFTPDEAEPRLKAMLYVRKYAYTVEWWLELSNSSRDDSDIVNELKYCDISMAPTDSFHSSAWKYPRFQWANGSHAEAKDFQPAMQNFTPEVKHVLTCDGGRASSGCMPYFNLQLQPKMGVLYAIGWNGQWKATLQKTNEEREVRVVCEMDEANFRVQPNETLVLPKMVALPWEGEMEDSFNAFRRFMKNDILPKYDGKPLQGCIGLRGWGGLTPEIHAAKFANVKKYNIGAEIYQIDAGWNGDETTPKSDQYYYDIWYKTVGIWKPLPVLYPNGLGQLNADCNDVGMGLAVWFEPERMPSWNTVVHEHRDFFIGAKLPEKNAAGNAWYLMVNLGYKPAFDWITDVLCEVIADSHMEIFRIDFNYEPLEFWKFNDGPDRKGVTEIKYVNGVYAMLDELLRRNPWLKIDNCASGGRRLDYRMFRRSMPMFCRSDYFCGQDNDPAPKQAHTYALNYWTPAHADSLGSCIGHTPEKMDTYRARSTMCSGIGMTAPWWEMTDEEGAWYRKILSEAKLVREYASEDFYPLTGYTIDERDWMAFQYNKPETESGLVMAFRREENETPRMTFALRGIDETAMYYLTDADDGNRVEMNGAALKYLSIEIDEKRSSRILKYEKI